MGEESASRGICRRVSSNRRSRDARRLQRGELHVREREAWTAWTQRAALDGESGEVEETLGSRAGAEGSCRRRSGCRQQFWGIDLRNGIGCSGRLGVLEILEWPVADGAYGIAIDKEVARGRAGAEARRASTSTTRRVDGRGRASRLHDRRRDTLWQAIRTARSTATTSRRSSWSTRPAGRVRGTASASTSRQRVGRELGEQCDRAKPEDGQSICSRRCRVVHVQRHDRICALHRRRRRHPPN